MDRVWYHCRRLAGNSDEPEATVDTEIDAGIDAAIDALVASGKHVEAAREAMRTGRYSRAAELFEKLWDFRNALEAARAGRDTPRVLRYAIELGDDQAMRDCLAVLTATDDGARTALEVLARLRRHADAAPLAERLGEVDRAIDLYSRAHRELDAVRLLESQGRDREAGRLLERALDLAAESERGKLRLPLGRILARGRAGPAAARALQEARK